jgi:hypothetical protein
VGAGGIQVALLVLTVCGIVRAQDGESGPFFRIFLSDGRTFASYGEYARVGDRVVFSLPLGEDRGSTRLHLTSVPADQVDWAATERYRDAVRASRYASARGDEDFAAMTSEVARTLNDIAVTEDKAAQLAMAERARRTLAEWPRDHYAFRAEDVRQILSILDEVVSELRAARGENRFDLNLVASVAPPAPVPILPPPTLQESIQQALMAARLAETSTDRISLAQSAVALVDSGGAGLPTSWTREVRSQARRTIAKEMDLTNRYTHLRTRALANATQAASNGDVRAVEHVLHDVRNGHGELHRARPDEVSALVAALEERLDAARRLRLARDQWAIKEGALRAYGDAVRKPFDDLGRARRALDDIRTLAGPDAGRLGALLERLAGGLARVRAIQPPVGAGPAHGVLVSALQLAQNAGRLRLAAVTSGDLKQAWDASAAAAGALMLADRAREELRRALLPPQLQ